jgi:NADH-quinone oxidoreductase subunit M
MPLPYLSILVLLPLFGAILLGIMPEARQKDGVQLGLVIGVVTFLWSIATLMQMSPGTFHFQLVESYPWIESLGIKFALGIDGITYWLVFLTTLLTLVAMAFSHAQKVRPKTLIALILVVETALLGAFLSLDLILFFSFFELMLLPTYFMVAIWGGEGRRKAAAKFLIYTFAGSIFMLVGIIGLALQAKTAGGELTFGLTQIQVLAANGQLWAGTGDLQKWIFWSFAIALLVKTPSFPFHSWMPDFYAEAPIIGPMISSVMIKLGTFGFLRFCLPLFPEASVGAAPILLSLAAIGILYGAVVAIIQTDMRRMIAYSSVSHMGFVLLGIFSFTHAGIMGAGIQQFAHGISTGLLVLLVGYLLSRKQTTDYRSFGGLKANAPILAAIFLFAILGSVGLPSLNGFVGEFLALLGAFEAGFNGSYGFGAGFAILAVFGVVLAAAYLLYMFQRTFYGEVSEENQTFKDLRPQELFPALIFAAFVLWGGLQPTVFLRPTELSHQAARMMAIGKPGDRPMWEDKTLEIASKSGPNLGALVRVEASREVGVPVTSNFVVQPATLHAPVLGEKPDSKTAEADH